MSYSGLALERRLISRSIASRMNSPRLLGPAIASIRSDTSSVRRIRTGLVSNFLLSGGRPIGRFVPDSKIIVNSSSVSDIGYCKYKRYRLYIQYRNAGRRKMNTTTTYELGASSKFHGITGGICWKRGDAIEGVKAWARNEKTGEYVRVYETAPTEWVQDEPQAWSTGNFETVETAQKWASVAYRYLNKGRR